MVPAICGKRGGLKWRGARAACVSVLASSLLTACAYIAATPNDPLATNSTYPAKDCSKPRAERALTRDAAAPQYALEFICDDTNPAVLVIFAFSGGGIRSASFGYGALKAASEIAVGPQKTPLSSEVDIVSGVSGGSFTAAAFASHGPGLLNTAFYRDNFLTHDFMSDLVGIYVEPWRWGWMLPDYGTNDEMADVYGGIVYASRDDKLFGGAFNALAAKGRPFLVIQATDFGNEQPFTFTQNDFDLICSDVDRYPLKNAIAASNGFPLLFSPMSLRNYQFPRRGDGDAMRYCHDHPPQWLARADAVESADLSRTRERARVAMGYAPPANGATADDGKPHYLNLQDGGVADNLALRGLINILAEGLDRPSDGAPGAEQSSAATSPSAVDPADKGACMANLDKVRQILIVSIDGEEQPDNRLSLVPYLSDVSRVFNTLTSSLIDSNNYETLFAAQALTDKLADRLMSLHCGHAPQPRIARAFAHVSFSDLLPSTPLASAKACGDTSPRPGRLCTVGLLARSGTSLHFSGDQVDALIHAGHDAFLCNVKLRQVLLHPEGVAPDGTAVPGPLSAAGVLPVPTLGCSSPNADQTQPAHAANPARRGG